MSIPQPAAGMSGRMVVAHFRDGRMIKGTTQDFLPNKPSFHVYEWGNESAKALEVQVDSLKAVFFVKSFEGDTKHVDEYDFDKAKGYGRKCTVTLRDGEVIAGYTPGYDRHRPGFFLVPAEESSNNARIFIVSSAIETLSWS